MELLIESSNLSCYQSQNGFAFVRVSGGFAPYSILWTNSNGDTVSTNVSARNLSADTYRVIVTDSYAASGSDTVVITEPPYEDPIPEIGMSLCELHNCFVPQQKSILGLLGYKYFVSLPEQGIDCECEQQKIIWAQNALEDICSWNPEGTQIENGITASLGFGRPQMSCSGGISTMDISAQLISSVDGLIASYSATGVLTAGSWLTDLIASFTQQINAYPQYSLVLDTMIADFYTITVIDSSHNGSTITLNATISNLTLCTITDPTWNAVSGGGIFTDTEGDAAYCTTDTPCLDASQIGELVELIKTITQNCNINEIKIETF